LNFRNGTVYEVISIIIKYSGLTQYSSVMEDSVRITKLKGMEIWPLWKFQMTVILTSSEVGSIISGDWAKPSSKITRTSEKETDEEAKLR
jgi:hypothetical protein